MAGTIIAVGGTAEAVVTDATQEAGVEHDALLDIGAIAEADWRLHLQPRSA